MENFDAEQPMEDLQGQTPKKEPKNPLYDCYSLLHDPVSYTHLTLPTTCDV